MLGVLIVDGQDSILENRFIVVVIKLVYGNYIGDRSLFLEKA